MKGLALRVALCLLALTGTASAQTLCVDGHPAQRRASSASPAHRRGWP
jgi:hypothetical protein